MNWNELTAATKINILAGESTVTHYLLLECDALVKAITNGASQEECMAIINANF